MYKTIISLAAVVGLFIAAGCGNTKKAETAEAEDTVAMEEEVKVETPEYCLTAEGIGLEGQDPIIKVGMAIADLPEGVEGLYQSYEKESAPDFDAYIFRYENEDGTVTEPFQVLDFGGRNVDVVQLRDETVKVKNGELTVTLMSPFTEVLALPGVKPIWEGYDYGEEGTWYWNWKGLYFQPEQEQLPEGLVGKLYDSHTQPTASDFTPEVRTGMVATGLPF